MNLSHLSLYNDHNNPVSQDFHPVTQAHPLTPIPYLLDQKLIMWSRNFDDRPGLFHDTLNKEMCRFCNHNLCHRETIVYIDFPYQLYCTSICMYIFFFESLVLDMDFSYFYRVLNRETFSYVFKCH